MSRKERGNVWLGVSGLVLNSVGEWLVVRKSYGGMKGMWSLPAGFVNGGETVDMAIIREVKEETGIDCQVEGMIGFRTGVLKGEISDNMAIFLLTPLDEKQLVIPELNEILEASWEKPNELKEDVNASVLIREISGKVMESAFDEIKNLNPGDRFGYTAYKMFFKK